MFTLENGRIDYGKPPGPLAKLLAGIVGLILLGASFFLGVVFLFATLLFVVIVAIVARFRGPARGAAPQSGSVHDKSILEGEYVVMDSQHQSGRHKGDP
jgi:hypothetical protein